MTTLNIVVKTTGNESEKGVSYLPEEGVLMYDAMREKLTQWLQGLNVLGEVRQHESGVLPLFYVDLPDSEIEAILSVKRPDFIRVLTTTQIPVAMKAVGIGLDPTPLS